MNMFVYYIWSENVKVIKVQMSATALYINIICIRENAFHTRPFFIEASSWVLCFGILFGAVMYTVKQIIKKQQAIWELIKTI